MDVTSHKAHKCAGAHQINISHCHLWMWMWMFQNNLKWLSLNMTVITELGGHTGKHGRHDEGRGNAPHQHADWVRGYQGGRVWAPVSPPVHGGQHLQQHNRPRLWHLSPGHAVCRQHHGSIVGSRELTQESGPQLAARQPCRRWLRVLAVPGEGCAVLLQRVLHPERLPAK